MIRHVFDLGFLFTAKEGDYDCICSRCLEQILQGNLTLRLIVACAPGKYMEYRYCEKCQIAEGLTPTFQAGTGLQQGQGTLGDHPSYRLTRREVKMLKQRTRRDRTLVNRGYMKFWLAPDADVTFASRADLLPLPAAPPSTPKCKCGCPSKCAERQIDCL